MNERSHPYVVRLALTLGSNIELVDLEKNASLPFGEVNLQCIPEQTPNRDAARFHKRLTLQLVAFASAADAERAGKALTAGILWFAAVSRITLGFREWTGEYPFSIRERTQQGIVLTSFGEGRAYYNRRPQDIASLAEPFFTAGLEPPSHVLISMEFFASARLEATDRGRFIALVTALEAFAVQQELSASAKQVLNEVAKQAEERAVLAKLENSLPASLAGRIRERRRESVRQALLRTVRQYLNDESTVTFVDEAYGVRSKVLHEGHRYPDLHNLRNRLESVFPALYSAALGIPLPEPAV